MGISELIEKLMRLSSLDPELRRKLLLTRNSSNPVSAFCAAAREAGVELYEMDLIAFGEYEHAAMKRSTNGGGENTPALEWQDDYYEILMTELESMGGTAKES